MKCQSTRVVGKLRGRLMVVGVAFSRDFSKPHMFIKQATTPFAAGHATEHTCQTAPKSGSKRGEREPPKPYQLRKKLWIPRLKNSKNEIIFHANGRVKFTVYHATSILSSLKIETFNLILTSRHPDTCINGK